MDDILRQVVGSIAAMAIQKQLDADERIDIPSLDVCTPVCSAGVQGLDRC